MTGWPRRKLSAVLRIQNGFAFDSKQFSTDGGTPLIRIRDLKNGLATETNFRGPFEQRYVVRAGDFLIGMDGEFGCFEWRGQDALLNQRVCKLTDFAAGIEPRFLFYGINSYLKEIEDFTTFTTVKHLSSKQIADIDFPLPPLDEQRRIVAVLDESFAAIATATANTEKNLANAREIRDLLHRRTFAELTGQEPLGRLAQFRNGVNFTSSSRGEEVQIVGVKDFKDNFSVPDKDLATARMDTTLPDEDLLRAGDILTVRSNGNKALIGRCMIAMRVEKRTAHSGFTIRIRVQDGRVDPEYLCLYLKSPEARERLVAGGAGANISSLNQKVLASLPVPVPLVVDQRRIVERLGEIDERSEKLEAVLRAKLAQLDALKQSLLHRAFSGDLKTREPLAA